MPLKNKTEKKELEINADILLDPEDQDRTDAIERSFLEHDALEFEGIPLRPVTAGTWMLLERSKNRLLLGDVSNAIADTAAFVLIHEEDNRAARASIFAGKFDEMIFEFLDELDGAHSKLLQFAPTIARMVEDYVKTQTQSISGEPVKKKSGRRTG
jgi:hypothetical protein